MRQTRILFYEFRNDDCFSDPTKNSKAGEPGGYRDLVNILRRSGYRVDTVTNTFIWQYRHEFDILILVLGRNSSSLSNLEIKSIQEYTNAGGRLFVIFDSIREVSNEINVNELLLPWCLRFNADLLWDQDDRVVVAEDSWRKRILIDDFDNHKITENIAGIWYWGCSLSILDNCERSESLDIHYLAKASSGAYSAKPGFRIIKDGESYNYQFEITALNSPYIAGGQRPLVFVGVEGRSSQCKVLVFGGRYCFNNDSLRLQRFGLQQYNHEKLFINSIAWLAEGQPNGLLVPRPSISQKLGNWYQQRSRWIHAFIIGVVSTLFGAILIDIFSRFISGLMAE